MNYKLLLLLCAYSIISLTPADASTRKKKKEIAKEPQKTETAYEKLFKKTHMQASGFMTLHRIADKLYFEIPLKVLGKQMLLGSTVTEISDGGDATLGSKPKEPLHIDFAKKDSSILMRLIDVPSVTREQDKNIAEAIRKSTISAILKIYPIKAYNADSTAVVIDITELFVGDYKDLEPLDDFSANTLGGSKSRTSRFQHDKSMLSDIKAFNDNVIVRSVLSYECDIRGAGGGQMKKPVTVVATRSLMLLPEVALQPRLADPRVGIFTTRKIKYTNVDNWASNVHYANRWRLEPKDLVTAQNGGLVEPKQPIVFYYDDNFPETWKQYIKMGVEDWNLAFEKIGFKNAVQALPFPKNDPNFDPDNIKYSCIRYTPIWMANAMGPSWTDPRSGEIVNASVYIYHNLVNILYNWRFVQTAAADPDVRVRTFSDEVMGDAIRYVVRHEVGHCFGFMHNMSSSSVFPVDSLRSPAFTQKYGTTASIMDYARFNYVAQPGDKEKGVKLTPPVLGEYDYFLVKWNYSPLTEYKTMEEKSNILESWVSEKAANPIYRYGKQQIKTNFDPSAQMEDLGDDAVKASEYGIKNLKYILKNLEQWFSGNDKDYGVRESLYGEVLSQYVRYLNHVYTNIGGIYLTEKYSGDPTPTYVSVPKERQRASLKFMMKQVKNMEWVENLELLRNFSLVGSPKIDLEKEVVNRIIDAAPKVALSALKSNDPYTAQMCMDDVYNFIWKDLNLAKPSSVEKRLQIEYVNALAKKISGSVTGGIKIGFTDELPKIKVPEYVSKNALMYDVVGDVDQESKGELVKGFGYLGGVNYTEEVVTNQIFYGQIRRVLPVVKNLLGQNISNDARQHYQLLLHRIEKALE